MKSKRNIIKIDQSLCNGCGACVSGCHEGALQMIDGKARIVSELYCDGLGACIGECPVGAIEIEEREAEPYDEVAVMERIAPNGEATVLAHLKHLKDHGESLFLKQGIEYLRSNGIKMDISSIESDSNTSVIVNEISTSRPASGVTTTVKPSEQARDLAIKEEKPKMACGCPVSMERSFVAPSLAGLGSVSQNSSGGEFGTISQPQQLSQLSHWPVQLHLLNPQAGFFKGADVVLAADCTAYAYPDFHNRFIRNHTLAIACPKLDTNKESYITKIAEMIDTAQINTLTVVIMEVPCCGGLIQLAKMAAEQAARKVPIKKIVIGVTGSIKEESWIWN